MKPPITAGLYITDRRPIAAASKSVSRKRLRSAPGNGKGGLGGYILPIWTPGEELFMLSLIHRIDGNIEMRLLPGCIDVARTAHTTIGAHDTTVAARKDGAFVDDHEGHAVSLEWVSVSIERSKVEAEAASLAGTASAGN